MYKRMRGRYGLILMLLSVWCLAGCSKEEGDAEVPPTVQASEATPTPTPKPTPTPEAQEPDIQVQMVEDLSDYAYKTLSEQEQIWYKDIEKALGGQIGTIELTSRVLEKGLDENDIDKIFQCVLIDHPEMYYVDGYTYTKFTNGSKTVSINFAGTYNKNIKEAKASKVEIAKAVQPILDGAAGLTSDYDKVKYVYETVILNTEYNLNASDNQNIYSVFVNGKSVCLGYAKATQYLLNRLGVECTLVQGTVNGGEGHAWNLVKIDDKYYHVDTTWGDASYNLAGGVTGSADGAPQISYDYLCVTDAQIMATHTVDSVITMPECKSTAANYYVNENKVFKTYDKQKMMRIFSQVPTDRQSAVAVQATNAECYEAMKAGMIDKQDVFDYLPSDNLSVYYSYNDAMMTLTFWMTNK